MSDSDDRVPSARIVRKTVTGRPGPSRADLLLWAFPLAFLPVLAGYFLAEVPVKPSLVAGALLGVAVAADALFVHPPGRTGEPAGDTEERSESAGAAD